MLLPFQKRMLNVCGVKALASLNITVVCLFLLFILTFWGTVAQVNNGLYMSQERFFHSWGFLALGFLPFPGARLVLWVLFVNLACVSLTKMVYRWSNIGIIVTHAGLLLFFIAAFVTYHQVEESSITLAEGEGTNVTSAYHDWEVSLWAESSRPERDVTAYDLHFIKPGVVLETPEAGHYFIVQEYFKNADAYTAEQKGQTITFQNQSGIKSFLPKPLSIKPEEHFPAIILKAVTEGWDDAFIALSGLEAKPMSIWINKKPYFIQIRRKRMEIPFVITLKDFMMELHPNTEMARSYKSLVEMTSHDSSRDVLISMNQPLRYKDYTLYQASYSIDTMGREHSTLAVVKNSGRVLPYIASFATVIGLLVHLLMMAFATRKKHVS